MPLITSTPYRIPIDLVSDFIGHWKLDEASGDAADSSGNGLTLTAYSEANLTYSTVALVNAGTSVTFPSGYAHSANIGFRRDGDATLNSITNNITASAWFSTTSSADQMFIFIRRNVSGTSIIWGIQMDAGGTISFFTNHASGGSLTTTTTTTWNDGNPHHVVGTWDRATGDRKHRIYIDGVLDTTSAGTTPDYVLRSFPTQPITIGYVPVPPYWDPDIFEGPIDDVKLFNRAFTDFEVAAEYNANKI